MFSDDADPEFGSAELYVAEQSGAKNEAYDDEGTAKHVKVEEDAAQDRLEALLCDVNERGLQYGNSA